jgi:phage terminase small subunit
MLGNPRQQKFVYEYIKDGDAKRALTAAGWTGKNVSVAASRLLKKPGIRREIESELENIRDATRVTKAYVVSKLKRVGERAEAIDDLMSANKSYELLGKSLGIFIDKQMNINISLEDILNASHQLDSGR